MPEFGNVSKLDENACKIKSDSQVPTEKENGSNVPSHQVESSEDSDDSDIEFEKVMKQKVRLEKEVEQLRKEASDKLKEGRRLTFLCRGHEKTFMDSLKNSPSIGREIRNKLSPIYLMAKESECYFQERLESSTNGAKCKNGLNGDDKLPAESRTSLLESRFSDFQEQLSKMKILMEIDNDVACQENSDYVSVIMKQCNKLEDSLLSCLSLFIKE